MTHLFSDTFQAILLGIVAVFFGLSWLARRKPHIGWLQAFRLPERRMSEEEKRRRVSFANRMSGTEFVLLGLALPLVYGAVTLMTWSDFDPVPTAIVLLVSGGCIVLGIWIVAKNS